MNILLTGASGQLGTELIPLLSRKGKLALSDRSEPGQARENWFALDVCDGVAVERLLKDVRPDLIVNAAAYTAVDLAEKEKDTAFEVNAGFPSRLAQWAQQNDALLLHYSTDYVFDGQASSPYRESDVPAPQNIYGESKLAGEQAVSNSDCRHTTLRTSWVYSSHGNNFVLSMLNLARKGIALNVVDDQRGCPTWAANLAAASIMVIDRWQSAESKTYKGLFHYCDDRAVSWYEFAGEVFKHAVQSGLLTHSPKLSAIPGSEFPQPATRPAWSVLDNKKIGDVFGVPAASFDQSLKNVIDQVLKRGF